MNRLAKLIDGLDKESLLLLQKDVDSGNIEKLISKRLSEYTRNTACPTCGHAVRQDTGYVLEFGPADLRQRARFDAPDCLQFFIKTNLSAKP